MGRADIRSSNSGQVKQKLASYIQKMIHKYVKLDELYPESCSSLIGSDSNEDLLSYRPKSQLPIHFAVQSGNTDLVHVLVSESCVNAVDCNGNTPLHYAVIHYNIEIIELLLSNFASPDIRNKKGFTPLHFAIIQGRINVVKLFIRYTIDIDIKDSMGNTGLFHAVQSNNPEVIMILSKSGAAVTMTNAMHDTVLHVAVRQNNMDTIDCVIKLNNDNINMKNLRDHTPLHVAVENGYTDVVKYLLHYNPVFDINSMISMAIRRKHHDIADHLSTMMMNTAKKKNKK